MKQLHIMSFIHLKFLNLKSYALLSMFSIYCEQYFEHVLLFSWLLLHQR